MSSLNPGEGTTPLEIEATSLSKAEWFALTSLMGLRPDAGLHDVVEFQKITLGTPRAQQMRVLQEGVEALMARGAIEYERDTNGAIVLGSAPGVPEGPVYKVAARGVRVVTRAAEFKPRLVH